MHSPAAPQGAMDELRANWRVLAGAALGTAFGSAALPFYTGGLFLSHLEASFGWTRTQLTAIGLVTTILVACTAPLAGAVFDRAGVRKPAAVGYLALALGFLYISFAPGSLLQFAFVQLFLALFALGAGPVNLTRPINLVFNRMRGLALGITIGGIGLTAAVAPPVVGRLIEDHGWRFAYQMLAVTVICVAPIVLLLLGSRRVEAKAAVAAVRAPPPQVLRDPLFWRLAAAFALVALGVSGFITHLVPMLTDDGMPALKAAQVAGLLGVAVLLGRLGVGFLVDRIFAPYVAAGVMLLTTLGFCLLAVDRVSFAAIGAFGIGLAMGAEVDLIAYLTARYFGMAHYGRLYGMLYGVFVLGTGVSPYIISVIQASSGSYEPALWLAAASMFAAVLLFLTAPRFPQKDHPHAPE